MDRELKKSKEWLKSNTFKVQGDAKGREFLAFVRKEETLISRSASNTTLSFHQKEDTEGRLCSEHEGVEKKKIIAHLLIGSCVTMVAQTAKKLG